MIRKYDKKSLPNIPKKLLKFESTEANKHEVGKLFYAIPYHICPTVAKYNKAYTVIKSEKTGTWDIDARDYI